MKSIAKKLGIEVEPIAPLRIVGLGPNINEATKKVFERTAKLFSMSYEEILIRVIVSGAVETGRLFGIVQISLRVPIRILEKLGIADIVIEYYELSYQNNHLSLE